jgi:hypothetical protein
MAWSLQIGKLAPSIRGGEKKRGGERKLLDIMLANALMVATPHHVFFLFAFCLIVVSHCKEMIPSTPEFEPGLALSSVLKKRKK